MAFLAYERREEVKRSPRPVSYSSHGGPLAGAGPHAGFCRETVFSSGAQKMLINRRYQAWLLAAGFSCAVTTSGGLSAQTPEAPPAKPVVPPQRTETIQYDNWTVTCQDQVGSRSSKKNCLASFGVLDKERRRILNWVIGTDQKGKPVFIVQVPQIQTGIALEPGLRLKLGSAADRKIDFVMCASNQCQTSTPIDRSLQKDLLAADNAVVTITSATGQAVKINVSAIKGTSRAVAALGL